MYPSAAGFEWIVVDNDSKDMSEEIVTNQFPSVRWINMGYNAGFARASNQGIRQCKGDTVLLLNPHTHPHSCGCQKGVKYRYMEVCFQYVIRLYPLIISLYQLLSI